MAETWDESKPAGSRSPALGDDDIREFKRAVRERLAEEHDFEATEDPAFGAASSTIGKHKFVTLVQRNTSKTTLSDEVSFVCKSVSGNPEVLLTPPSAGTDRQLTKNSGANLNLNSGDFANRIIPANALDTGAVDAAAMGGFSVAAANLQTGCVISSKISALAVNSSQLDTSSVVNAKMGADAVGAAHMTHGLGMVWAMAGILFNRAGDSYATLTDSVNGYEASIRIKMPSNPSALRLYAECKDYSGQQGHIRLYCGGQVSTAINTPDSYTWTDCGTVDVSGLTPGTIYELAVQGEEVDCRAFSIWWE